MAVTGELDAGAKAQAPEDFSRGYTHQVLGMLGLLLLATRH